jgi:hypothetical protein
LSTTCHICQAEAIARCYNCGELVCAEHGKNKTCPGCSTGIAAGDPRADRISAAPVPPAQTHNHGWWRPKPAEEYQPPACYECQGLARGLCRNCQATYCHEHAGPRGLCRDCGRSARFGTYVFFGMFSILVLLLLWHRLFG